MREDRSITLGEAILDFREKRDAPFADSVLCDWISEIDTLALDEVVKDGRTFIRYDCVSDRDVPLVIPFPDTFVYFAYLSLKCDTVLGDLGRYNLSATVFENAWRAYADRYVRSHLPKKAELSAGGALERY